MVAAADGGHGPLPGREERREADRLTALADRAHRINENGYAAEFTEASAATATVAAPMARLAMDASQDIPAINGADAPAQVGVMAWLQAAWTLMSTPTSPQEENMTSMDRIDVIHLAMSNHFIHRARKDSQGVPTEADLIHLHEDDGSGEWEDLVDDLVRAAHPFVSEDGTWIRHHAGQTVVEEVGIDDVLAAARYARIQVETIAHGDYALGRAVSDALCTAAGDIIAEATEILHQALTAPEHD